MNSKSNNSFDTTFPGLTIGIGEFSMTTNENGDPSQMTVKDLVINVTKGGIKTSSVGDTVTSDAGLIAIGLALLNASKMAGVSEEIIERGITLVETMTRRDANSIPIDMGKDDFDSLIQ